MASDLLTEVNEYYKLLFPILIQYIFNTKPKDNDFVSSVVKKHYFGNEPICTDTTDNVTQVRINIIDSVLEPFFS